MEALIPTRRLTDPAQCTGPLSPESRLRISPRLLRPDQDGAVTGFRRLSGFYRGRYTFNGHADIREVALFVQDTITLKNWTFNLGIRGDIYHGITQATQAEPRVGIAYNFKRTNTVLRVSYARTLETPFNENLVLSSTGCNDPVVNALQSATQGYPCITNPLSPGWRNEFHVGLQQAFGRYFVVDAEYIWKYTHLAYDFSVFGNTPIFYPIEWASSKIPGFAIRGSVPNFHGLTALCGHVVRGGALLPTTSQRDRCHSHRFGWYRSFPHRSRRKIQSNDSLAVPAIGRRDHGSASTGVSIAASWPDPSRAQEAIAITGRMARISVVDVSGLTPDQQFEAGLFCVGVHATPTMPISPTGFCAASQYGSNLVKDPGAWHREMTTTTRLALHNGTLFDLAVGDDNLFHGDRYKWSARVEVINLANAIRALQLPIHFQRNALRHAPHSHRDHWLSTFSFYRSACPAVVGWPLM